MLLVAFNLSNFVLSVLIISPVFLLLLRFCTFHWIHSVVPDNSATLSTNPDLWSWTTVFYACIQYSFVPRAIK